MEVFPVCGFEGIYRAPGGHTSMYGGRCFSSIKDSIVLDSSVVEHSAVNRRVVGSSPTRGVLETFHRRKFMECFYLFKSPGRLSRAFLSLIIKKHKIIIKNQTFNFLFIDSIYHQKIILKKINEPKKNIHIRLTVYKVCTNGVMIWTLSQP